MSRQTIGFVALTAGILIGPACTETEANQSSSDSSTTEDAASTTTSAGGTTSDNGSTGGQNATGTQGVTGSVDSSGSATTDTSGESGSSDNGDSTEDSSGSDDGDTEGAEESLVLQWEYTWNSGGNDLFGGLAVDADNNIYLGGYTHATIAGQPDPDPGGFDQLLVKIDSDSNLEWERLVGGAETDETHDVVVSSDGFIYQHGYSYLTETGRLTKWDSAGTLIWQEDDIPGRRQADLAAGPDGEIYHGGTDIQRWSTDGDLEWAAAHQLSATDTIEVAIDGSVYIGGPDISQFDNLSILSKYSPEGVEQWTTSWGTMGAESRHMRLATDSEGWVYAFTNEWTGEPVISPSDFTLTKFDPDTGTTAWERRPAWAAGEHVSTIDIAMTEDDEFYAVGLIIVGGFLDQRLTLSKWTSDGDLIWETTWLAGPNLSSTAGRGVAVDGDGAVYVAGISLAAIPNNSIYVSKWTWE